jgi:hypothetical protein
MRLVELIGCRVIDSDGRDIGGVHDVRLVADGAPDANGRRSYRLDALVVGSGGGAAHRLGYSDSEMGGPWPLSIMLTRAAHRSMLVEWAAVETIERPTVRIRPRRDDLRTLADEARQGGKP